MLYWRDVLNQNMDFQTIILPLLTSILVGGLIGLEREKAQEERKSVSPVGIRTDILISLFGAISVLLGKTYHPTIFLICLSALLVFSIASYIYLAITQKRIGITTEISTILVYLLGALAMMGSMQLAVILAIFITLTLSLRNYLHRAINHLNHREILDTIKFSIITFIILPFLPNKSFDDQIFRFLWPGNEMPAAFHQIEILNPYNIWFLVVLVSGISFLGYVLVKTIGRNKGISVTGLIGGLYSSTATSLALAHKSKAHPQIQKPFITGIVLACSISFLRTFIELRALNEQLFWRSFLPISMMFIYLLTIGLVLFFSKKEKSIHNGTEFTTPFKLTEALKLSGFIVGALFIAKVLLSYGGVNYYYLIAAAMALFAIDDPIIISTAASAGTLVNFDHAKNIILMVTYLNMVQKVGLVYFFGNRKLTKPIAWIFGGLFLVSLAGFLYF